MFCASFNAKPLRPLTVALNQDFYMRRISALGFIVELKAGSLQTYLQGSACLWLRPFLECLLDKQEAV